jgi:PadR family transcriptional regulator, regulatory protein PadR
MGADHGVSAERCAGSGSLPKNFLHPCLLLLLKEEEGYGYDLVGRLKKLGVDDDSATVYRALRTLEERHAVSSHWNTSSTGPARHVYRLTPAGEEELLAAFEAAVDTHRSIQRYFSRYAAAEGSLSEGLQSVGREGALQ